METINDWRTDQKLIKEAIKRAKEIFPNGFNKLHLCAIGKRLHDKEYFDANIISEDVSLIKSKQLEIRKEEAKRKEEIIKRNQFKSNIIENQSHYEIDAYDYEDFKKIVIGEVIALIKNERDYLDKSIIGADKEISAIWNGIEYTVYIELFWEKGENWNYSITNHSTNHIDKGWDYKN